MIIRRYGICGFLPLILLIPPTGTLRAPGLRHDPVPCRCGRHISVHWRRRDLAGTQRVDQDSREDRVWRGDPDDRDCGGDQWTCCSGEWPSTQIHVDVRLSRTAEIYICANVPQLGAPGLALVVRDVCLDAHHHGAVDRRVGYRQCDSRV